MRSKHGTIGQVNRMNDLISRQAAIDALDFEIVHMTAYCDGKNEGNPLAQYNKGLEDGKKAIEALPSAQPERTCVNCGRTANNGGWYADGGTRCPIEEHYALPKDGFCHLWEKRNVTDDDYPKRSEE